MLLRRLCTLTLAVVTVVTGLLVPVGGAAAAPATPAFSRAIDAYPRYETENGCDPTAKPGAVEVQRILRAAYGSIAMNTPRACSASNSGHEEGRAVDWMTNVRNPGQAALANDFITWLLAPDQFGNQHAMARRLGVSYLIWDSKKFYLWNTGAGWTEYSDCMTVRVGAADDNTCHRNHVHISLSWAGARAQTSWYTGGVPTTPSTSGVNPIGHLDGGVAAPGGITVSGWTMDLDVQRSIAAHVYADGRGTAVVADRPRPDVAGVFPDMGPLHGFQATVPTSATSTVCAYGINQGKGDGNTTLGCRTFRRAVNPTGWLDEAVRTGPSVRVRGWALDPDTETSVQVHVYVSGAFAGQFTADAARGDIAVAYPGWGAGHGWQVDVPAAAGAQVCVYAINTLLGDANTTLGCATA